MRKEILDQAKKEAQEILAASNRMVESTIREIKEAAAEKERTREVRQKLEEFKEEVSKKAAENEELINRKMEKLLRREDRKKDRPQKSESTKPVSVPKKQTEEIQIGSWVKLKDQSTAGEVLEIKDDKITVAFGQLRSTVKKKNLELVSRNESKRMSVVNSTLSRINAEIGERKLNFKPNIDVRGMRAEEALQKIQEFLDEAIMVEAKEIRILHGKGNGILRELIQNYLRTEPAVRSCRDEHVQFGGSGITIVQLD
jgi:DNA mismatch repair protein MutS2